MKETPSKQLNYKFVIDKDREIWLNMPSGVFVPTGTTSALIRAVLAFAHKPAKLLDLGCGSGVVGITLYQSGLVKAPFYASDLNKKAIECTKKNSVFYRCPVLAKCGPLFEPWKNKKFDYIVDDVAAIAEDVAKISPWYKDVPCHSGDDGTLLITEVLYKAAQHLNKGGLFFFPVVSLSNVGKFLTAARKNFSHVKLLIHEDWALPKEMYQYSSILKKLRKKRHIEFMERFGMLICFTDVYVAFNS